MVTDIVEQQRRTNPLHCFAEGDVIRNDFRQLGKMPAVPFLAAHDVIVRFFVEIVQKRCTNRQKLTNLSDESVTYR